MLAFPKCQGSARARGHTTQKATSWRIVQDSLVICKFLHLYIKLSQNINSVTRWDITGSLFTVLISAVAPQRPGTCAGLWRPCDCSQIAACTLARQSCSKPPCKSRPPRFRQQQLLLEKEKWKLCISQL